LCDLLQNAEDDQSRWGFRSHRAIEFTGQAVGYRVYKDVCDGLLREGMIERVAGHQQHSEFGGTRVPSWRKAPRIRTTPLGIALAASAGITPQNWRDHFDIVRTKPRLSRKPPLVCRAASMRAGAIKYKGSPLPLDLTDPEVLRLQAQVTRINAFIGEHEITGESHLGFQRIFHARDDDKCRWDKGGRLYSVGHGNYQRAKKASRANMSIDGQPVVELDLTASHLTILHALRGLPFDPCQDPYFIKGLPRNVVKSWVTMTLGHHKLHRSWPKGIKDDLDDAVGGSLVQAFPIGKTREAILERLPLLADWADSPIDWGDLQFVESQVIMQTIENLAFLHGVPCLPVHDSIIVPSSDQDLASQVLREAFGSIVGVVPHLKVA
jgi:hypothetical protein